MLILYCFLSHTEYSPCLKYRFWNRKTQICQEFDGTLVSSPKSFQWPMNCGVLVSVYEAVDFFICTLWWTFRLLPKNASVTQLIVLMHMPVEKWPVLTTSSPGEAPTCNYRLLKRNCPLCCCALCIYEAALTALSLPLFFHLQWPDPQRNYFVECDSSFFKQSAYWNINLFTHLGALQNACPLTATF